MPNAFSMTEQRKQQLEALHKFALQPVA